MLIHEQLVNICFGILSYFYNMFFASKTNTDSDYIKAFIMKMNTYNFHFPSQNEKYIFIQRTFVSKLDECECHKGKQMFMIINDLSAFYDSV